MRQLEVVWAIGRVLSTHPELDRAVKRIIGTDNTIHYGELVSKLASNLIENQQPITPAPEYVRQYRRWRRKRKIVWLLQWAMIGVVVLLIHLIAIAVIDTTSEYIKNPGTLLVLGMGTFFFLIWLSHNAFDKRNPKWKGWFEKNPFVFPESQSIWEDDAALHFTEEQLEEIFRTMLETELVKILMDY